MGAAKEAYISALMMTKFNFTLMQQAFQFAKHPHSCFFSTLIFLFFSTQKSLKAHKHVCTLNVCGLFNPPLAPHILPLSLGTPAVFTSSMRVT